MKAYEIFTGGCIVAANYVVSCARTYPGVTLVTIATIATVARMAYVMGIIRGLGL